MDHGVAADQAVRIGGGAGPHHTIDRIHHNKSTPDDGQDFRCAVRQQRFSDIKINDAALTFADFESEHAKDAKRQAYQAGYDTYEQWIHVSSLCCGNTARL
ncbi:hypothetical protein GCM10010523_30480 [Paenarthrobacter ilicis]